MKIKPLTKKDIENLHKLWKDSGLPIKPDGRDSIAHLYKELNGEQSIFLKATDDEGKMIGVALGTHDGRKGWINRLAVHPEHRGKGIAKQLISEIEIRLGEMDIYIVASLIEGYNTKSMSLFENLGYKKHTEISYYSKRKSGKI